MERSERLLNRDHSILVIVDMQETLLKAIKVGHQTANNIHLLIQTARTLEIPVIFTTQNAQKLGGVLSALETHFEGAPVIDKLCFSCVGSEEFVKELQSQGRTQVVLTGIEAHICIMQTAMDLLRAGYAVHVPYDAVASRQKRDWKYALLRLANSGVVVTSIESVIYEWLQEAGTEQFRSVLPLLKEREDARIRAEEEDDEEESEEEAESSEIEEDDGDKSDEEIESSENEGDDPDSGSNESSETLDTEGTSEQAKPTSETGS